MKNKYCGNCKHFTNEDVNGYGWCSSLLVRTTCGSGICREYEEPNNGWTEITPDNSDDLYKKDEDRIIIAYCHNEEVSFERYVDSQYIPSEMGELGGFYYYVLPELRIHNEQAD